MVRTLVGSAGQIALAVGAANDTTAPAIGDGSIVALLKRIRDNTASGGGGGGAADGVPTDPPATLTALMTAPTTAYGFVALLKGILSQFHPVINTLGLTSDATIPQDGPSSIVSAIRGIRLHQLNTSAAIGLSSDSPPSWSTLSMMPSTAATIVGMLKGIGSMISDWIVPIGVAFGSGWSNTSTLTSSSTSSQETTMGLLKALAVRLHQAQFHLKAYGDTSRRPTVTLLPFNTSMVVINPTASSYSVSPNNENYLLSLDVVNNSGTTVFVWLFGAASPNNSTYAMHSSTNMPAAGLGLLAATGDPQVIQGPWIVTGTMNLALGAANLGITGQMFYGSLVLGISSTLTTFTPFANPNIFGRIRWVRRDTAI
jgi:hypothetical protein